MVDIVDMMVLREALVDFEAVQASVTPAPEGYHYPIPHSRILDLAVEGLEQ